MRLITELNETIKPIIVEETGTAKKKYFIEGTFLQANIKNRNGRIYPVETMDREVARYVKECILQNRAFGEMGHPSGPGINLERVSHMITELKKDGDNYIGKAKILDTPYGLIVKNLIDEGAKLGVSSRALGTLEEKNGVSIVQDDLNICTAADIVADPSAPDAFVRGIMEGKEWVLAGGKIKEQSVEQAKKVISSVAIKEEREKVAMHLFERYLKALAVKSYDSTKE